MSTNVYIIDQDAPGMQNDDDNPGRPKVVIDRIQLFTALAIHTQIQHTVQPDCIAQKTPHRTYVIFAINCGADGARIANHGEHTGAVVFRVCICPWIFANCPVSLEYTHGVYLQIPASTVCYRSCYVFVCMLYVAMQCIRCAFCIGLIGRARMRSSLAGVWFAYEPSILYTHHNNHQPSVLY